MGALKRVMWTSSLAAASLCLAPSESKAIFHWFKSCCGTPAPVAVAPVVTPTVAAVPSCDPCQQTVAYVPQTTYRVQYVATPVQTFRPVTSCSPCGGTTTAFMPVTTMQTQAQMVPTTSYRLVYPTTAVAATSYYTPVTASYATAAPAASSCCGGTTTTAAYAAPAATTTYSVAQPGVTYQQQPATTYPQQYQQPYSQQPAPAATTPPSTYANGNGQPTLQSIPPQQQQQQQQQYKQPSPSDGQQQPTPAPIPDAGPNGNPTSSGPSLSYPAHTTQYVTPDRWASAVARPAVHTVSARAPIDDGGWRPAR